MIQREGTLTETIYHNETSGYRVCLLETGDQRLTLVGVMPGVKTGDRIRASGRMTVHPRYGEQMQVETFEPLLPEDREAAQAYLASGMLPGVGEAIARRMLDTFGMDVFEIMAEEPERLQEVRGIGKRRWPEIAAAYREQHALRRFVVWMGRQGVDARLALKLYQAYGEPGRDMFEENPYQFLETLPEIGFARMDRLARRMGMDPEDPRRVESGLLTLLQNAQQDGHVCLPREELTQQARETLEVGENALKEAIQSLALDQTIQVTRLESGEEWIYPISTYQAETETAKRLASLAGSAPLAVPEQLEEKLRQIEASESLELAPAQREGIRTAFAHRVSVITGGPGTGKTTLINTLMQLLEEEGFSVLLGAPTGRAAKRMTEASGRDAQTLHRLLEVTYSEEDGVHYFNRDENHPLESDFVIVDEVSMVDIFMMQHLLRAVGPATALVLTGDADQLPSVGPGTVLQDMTESGLIPVIRLTDIFRQARESLIVVNAHRINAGEPPALNDRNRDFFFIPASSPDQAQPQIATLIQDRLPAYRGFDPLRDIQVLTPVKKGAVGTRQLNRHLQQTLNPPSSQRREYAHGDRLFREGDRVMQIRNNYALEWERDQGPEAGSTGRGVFNGDLGRVEAIHPAAETLTLRFDDHRVADYPFPLLDELEPAYAITVHKSQGSEFPVVVMPVFPGPPMLMTRNLLYTAVTRARVLVVLIGRRETLHRMVTNDRIQFRYSGLTQRLQQVLMFLETDPTAP